MVEESFLLVSLEEKQAKKLAEVISNDSCRRILDYIGKNTKGVTETQIAKDLNIPLSTVHYNMQNLAKANLVKADEYHYSSKGKEVNHYTLTNKLIIIAPTIEKSNKIMNSLKRLIPNLLVILGISALIEIMQRHLVKPLNLMAVKNVADAGGERIIEESIPMLAANTAPEAAISAQVATQPWFYSSIALWFFFGGIFALVIHFLMEVVRKK
ncbi:MAG: helix-turn-helix domain-containing protein [Candidatus Woesearchaeota archaeon]